MSYLSGLKPGVASLAILILAGTATAQEPLKFVIGLASGSMPTSAPRLASQLGLFAKHGLEPKIIQLDDASTATTALISRSVDFTVTAPTDAIIGQARGQPLVAVATIYGGYSPVIVLSKKAAAETGLPASASAAERLKALDGRLIASTSPTSNFTLGLNCATASAGAKPRITFMSQPAMVAALEKGVVDGFLASAPFWGLPVANNTAVAWVNGPKGEFSAACSTTYAATLNTTSDYAKTNPLVIERIRAVFAEFADIVRQRPGEVKAAIAKQYPDVSPTVIELLFESDASGYAAKPPTAQGIAHEIELVKKGGVAIPGLDAVDPARVVLP